MKLLRKITIISTSVLMVAGNAVKANADYTYTVTFDSGSGYGTITGDASGSTYKYNDPNPVGGVNCPTPDDSKYYFKGWHVSGVEGTDGFDSKITKDIVYVATYGIKDKLTSYTVTYSDTAGNPLASSQTFYGNIGDKPVLPYLYIEGFEPQAYNLTKTLSSNAADNVFPFVYTPIAAVPTGEGGTTYTYVDVDGGVTVVTVPGGGGGGAAPAGGGGAPAGGGGAGPAPAVIPDNTPPAAGPEQIIDIDENQTPAGGFSPAPTSEASASPETIPEPGTPGGGMSNAWKIALATGGGIGLLLLLLLLLRRKDNLS